MSPTPQNDALRQPGEQEIKRAAEKRRIFDADQLICYTYGWQDALAARQPAPEPPRATPIPGPLLSVYDELRSQIPSTPEPKISLTIRVGKEELEAWKRKAGKNLSAWIRERCNGQSDRDREVVAELPRDLHSPAKRRKADSGARSRKTPVCAHGVAKGVHCWQCGGLAIVHVS